MAQGLLDCPVKPGNDGGWWAFGLNQPELGAGVQELLRVDRLAVDAGLVMQVRPGGASGRAHAADGLAGLDGLADLHVDLRHVAVARREAVAVVDLDQAAVAAAPAGRYHLAAGGDVDRLAGVAAE